MPIPPHRAVLSFALVVAVFAAGETVADPPTTQAENAPAATERNRLSDETSPYLLQHQHNPVHWWPWGLEAIEHARKVGKPIFLSVGYSTCYWCHVMERESFEKEEVAAVMNEHFVCIKVDREERPDVDDIYMVAVQMFTNGGGGWPMSVFIDPESLRPFFGGTYFPPEDRYGRPGFVSLMNRVAEIWATKREDIRKDSQRTGDAIIEQFERRAEPVALDDTVIESAIGRLLLGYDKTNAGFGRKRKFPMPVNLDFLIATAWDRPEVQAAVVHTLDRMATGGLYDQVGGGFHRYTVDEEWLVPHFEKMLYDNGQLASTYAEVYSRTNDPYYAEVLRETLEYVRRLMTSPDGAFLSAQDAEVNHREGQNYLWTPDEVRRVLTAAGLEADVPLALTIYGFDGPPNFRDPHHPNEPAQYVVRLQDRPEKLAAQHDLDDTAFGQAVRRINTALLAVRDTRDQPHTDDKILVAWNGLMIAGMADGGRVLGETRYIDAARRAAEFILTRMRRPDGGLYRTARGGTQKIDAFLEDYAMLIHGLLALDRATSDDALLTTARELTEAARTRFWDSASGGYYDTQADQSDLFVRVKSTYDGAVPSANGTMLRNLVELHDRTGDERYLDDAVATAQALSQTLRSQPTGAMMSMIAVHRLLEVAPTRLGAAPATVDSGASPVKIEVTPSTVTFVAPGDEHTIEVAITLAERHHMSAHDPGLDGITPLRIAIVDAAGLEIDVAYPESTLFRGPVGEMRVFEDRLVIPVTIRCKELRKGRRSLMIEYQVCTDRACLAPVSERLPVEFPFE